MDAVWGFFRGDFLAVREASKNWRSIHHWKQALQSFQVMFGEERVPMNAL
ncbi:hypothetical protein [Xanthomonas oryzae]|nr:hypothetical protein [Xanthomonas oryzae]WVN06982.1 hypothetical protein V1208_02180 [Xanthomonas oryzae pv. oryzicola]